MVAVAPEPALNPKLKGVVFVHWTVTVLLASEFVLRTPWLLKSILVAELT
ncbi:hypothetical protein CEV31_1972 [Brucella thiophenivorans]|uniref:Uncharacterized protein n=1 Tax=Brucella thiophenivorans TaxID=571255 RepID=A0A256FX40_9HYPH|nr:hypothetical protein CEV31_1972 [Brucella thiophenivorans]